MRIFLLALLTASICGCGIIYKLPTRQGNVIEQDELDKLKVGMSREQVRFVMGTPIAATSLQPNRWDYLGYYKSPRGEKFTRKVSLYFEADKLARMTGTEAPKKKEQPEIEGTAADAPPAATEPTGEEPKTGVVITPK